jgi:HSP20 family protein
VKETVNEIVVSAEMPGLHEKDIDVSLAENMLVLRGEKKEEKEHDVKGYYRMERHFGSFQRAIPLPCEVDPAKVEAFFKHGVITVVLPKLRPANVEEKKIVIKPM